MKADASILSVIEELDALGRRRDDACQIPRVEGELLHQIALGAGTRAVVEIGTSYGFSGLFWAAAMRRTGGHLHTIDNDPKKRDASREAFARAGVADVVTNWLGDAREVVPKLDVEFDIGFIDADKPSCRTYFDLIWEKLRVGGSVLTDNATTHREELAEFVRYVRSRADAVSTEVAVGNGIEWTVKTG